MMAHGVVFAKRPEACFCLSGTPIKNNAPEFYSVLKLMSYCPTDTNGVRIPEKNDWAFATKFSYPRKRTYTTSMGTRWRSQSSRVSETLHYSRNT